MEIDIVVTVQVPDEHAKILEKFPRAELVETCAATSHQAVNKMLAMLIVAYQGGYVDDDLQMVEGAVPEVGQEIARLQGVLDSRRPADPEELVGNVVDLEAYRRGGII